MEDIIKERFTLAEERIKEIAEGRIEEHNESKSEGIRIQVENYFVSEAKWLQHLFHTYHMLEDESFDKLSLDEHKKLNHAHYEELLGKQYESSYANPAFAVKELGEKYGAFFSAIHVELRQGITFIYHQNAEEFIASVELFLEIVSAFTCAWEGGYEPDYEEIRQIYYWYVSDYAEIRSERQVKEIVVPVTEEEKNIALTYDLSDLRYLYRYGLYVSDCELRTAVYINNLPEERIALMANTFTEGYRIGFIMGNKDISIKESVNVYYHLGFERVVRKAADNFKKIGLHTILSSRFISSTPANRQYSYDHKDDSILFFDKQYMNRKLETMKAAFEMMKKEAKVYGGPALLDVFGETPFSPVPKKEALKADEKYQKLMVEFVSQSRKQQSEYIIEEERSFTIIAFPTPDIGDQFEEIFDEIIRINTLDYKLYQGIQQTIIDALDTAEYVEIKGCNGNHTNMKVMLMPLKDASKETKFENCVADVNIPVGEVFTSPVLKGTEGVLHVSKVFLSELEYKDLELTFKDGMITDYSCSNFEDAEEGRRYIQDNVLFHHDTLPIGEFAIGTNTTAYVVADKYGIGSKLPILIAEKMGPHFAVGDTCYSQVEDVKVYNPDGKEIIARENAVSALRKEDMTKAYFNCHTDITIPYHELGEISVVRSDGSRIIIIKDGRFVLDGCEELNKPFNHN